MVEQQSESKLHIPRSFRDYHGPFSQDLERNFPLYSFREAAYGDGMPLLLVEEVPNVVMAWLLNGDNYADAMLDLNNAHVLKQDTDLAGPNVQRLGIFSPYTSLRGDQRTLKWRENKRYIVKGQSNFAAHLADTLQKIKADYFVGIDIHSLKAVNYMKQAGVDVINLTASYLLMDNLRDEGYLENNLETIFCGVDYGNLPLMSALKERYGFDIAIMGKKRDSEDGKATTNTEHTFLHGNVKNKRVILMDDIFDSGGTILHTVELLLEAGAAEIIVCGTHRVFGKDNYDAIFKRILGNDKVKIVKSTNTLPLRRPRRSGDKDEPHLDLLELEMNTGKNPKKVQELDITPFMINVVKTLLLSNGDTNKIREQLKDYTFVHKPWEPIFEELTGRPAEPLPEVAGIYREGGRYEPFPQK